MEVEDDESPSSATVFMIELKEPNRTSIPDLSPKFSATAWCRKQNIIACASETCARTTSSEKHPQFWIPVYILNPERPTEYASFHVKADASHDLVQYIEWSPASCPRALLVANYHGRITIWAQPSKGLSHPVRDSSCWECAYEWHQETAVVTKWLSGTSLYGASLSSCRSTANSRSTFDEMLFARSTFEEMLFSLKPHSSARWPIFLCVCSILASGSVQLHWSQWPLSQEGAAPKWFSTEYGRLGDGPSGVIAADVIITEAGIMLVAGVPIANPFAVVVWEVAPGHGNGTALASTSYSPLAAYLFSWQEYFEEKQVKKQINSEFGDAVSLHCSSVSSFSTYVSHEVGNMITRRVTAIAFDPARGGSVITVVTIEGPDVSSHDPDEGLSMTGWRVQCWESSLQPVVVHSIFGGSASSFEGQVPTHTVWVNKVNRSILLRNMWECLQESVPVSTSSDNQNTSQAKKVKRSSFSPHDVPRDLRTFARIVYFSLEGEVAISFLNGEVHIFLGASLTPIAKYIGSVISGVAGPCFSSTGCCLASVWHDTCKDSTLLKITRVIPPGLSSKSLKVNAGHWEGAIADRFWWSLLEGVDWWDVVGCTQSAAEDGIVPLKSVIVVLDADFHSLPSQYRQQHRSDLDMIKCRLLEGTDSPDVKTLVLDMQARLLLDMLGKGIESALLDPTILESNTWKLFPSSGSGAHLVQLTSTQILTAFLIKPALVSYIEAYVDAVLDLASHFIKCLRSYADFLWTSPSERTSGKDAVTSSMPSLASLSTNQAKALLEMPAIWLIGDRHFRCRLCQLLHFCGFFLKRHLLEGEPGVKGSEDKQIGSGNAGSRYTCQEVYEFSYVIKTFCDLTAQLEHRSSPFYFGGFNIQNSLHYIDGYCNVSPEVVEASLGLQIPVMLHHIPRPGDAGVSGLLLRELELQPPAEEWHRRNMVDGIRSDTEHLGERDDGSFKFGSIKYDTRESQGIYPKRRRTSEREAALGLSSSHRVEPYIGLMGTRRDVLTMVRKESLQWEWYKCIRCLRQTSAFTSPVSANQSDENKQVVASWISRWSYCCPMCGGAWVKVG